jgi:hypothetical protein
MFDDVLKRLVELEGTNKKIDLLERKRDRMGLYDEEVEVLFGMKEDYFFGTEKIIKKMMKELINVLMSKKGKKNLANIQKMVSWNGEKIITFEDFENILIFADQLSSDEINDLDKELTELHLDVFKGLESFCEKKEVYNALDSIGRHMSVDGKGGIADIVQYIDDIYKDFGEIFGIELPEVKLFYY